MWKVFMKADINSRFSQLLKKTNLNVLPWLFVENTIKAAFMPTSNIKNYQIFCI